MREAAAGTGGTSHSPHLIGVLMSYDLGSSLLTVLGVLVGIGALLYVMAVLDPTNVRAAKQLPTHRGARGRVDTPGALT